MTDAKYAVLTLVKINHRTPETRLNPHLIYLSRLEQMHVELTDEQMDTHGDAGVSYEFCMKSGMKLRYDVSKSDQLTSSTIKNIKIKSIMQNPPKSHFFVRARAMR